MILKSITWNYLNNYCDMIDYSDFENSNNYLPLQGSFMEFLGDSVLSRQIICRFKCIAW